MKLELKDVTHVYPNGKKALDHVSLGLMPGIYGLLGPNGAGKSTMMKIITDHLLPTSGQVLFQGKDIRKVSREFRSCLGYMPQQQGMYQQFTGRRFLWYMASLKGLRRREAKDRIAHLLEVVNLTEAADRKIGGYSGGMKQRLLIAQAVLTAVMEREPEEAKEWIEKETAWRRFLVSMIYFAEEKEILDMQLAQLEEQYPQTDWEARLER